MKKNYKKDRYVEFKVNELIDDLMSSFFDGFSIREWHSLVAKVNVKCYVKSKVHGDDDIERD